jgi:mono/diheme cytochrome c family protein
MKHWLGGFLVLCLANLGIATGADAVSTAPVSNSKSTVHAGARSKAASLRALKNEDSKFHPTSETNSAGPTYRGDLLPLFMGKCFRCHNDQTRFLKNWLDYKTAFADRWELKRRIWDSWRGEYFKQPMPTVNSPESENITEEERNMIREWVERGAVLGVAPKESNPHSKAERMEAGRRLFTTICAACHQPSAQGIPGRFPPLAGSDFLNGNKERAIQVVINGLQGEVVVNGLRFNNSMPVFPLSDGDIAAALTYVYNSFGNSGKDVTQEEVKALRGQPGMVNLSQGQGNQASSPQEKSPWE